MRRTDSLREHPDLALRYMSALIKESADAKTAADAVTRWLDQGAAESQ